MNSILDFEELTETHSEYIIRKLISLREQDCLSLVNSIAFYQVYSPQSPYLISSMVELSYRRYLGDDFAFEDLIIEKYNQYSKQSILPQNNYQSLLQLVKFYAATTSN